MHEANALRKPVFATLLLGILSAVAVVFCVLALFDINQQEENQTLEWLVLVISVPIVLGFHGMAFITLTRVLAFLSSKAKSETTP
jgi:uncharacterized membrane protein